MDAFIRILLQETSPEARAWYAKEAQEQLEEEIKDVRDQNSKLQIQVNKSSVEAVDDAQKKQKEAEKKMEQAEAKARNEKKRAEMEIRKTKKEVKARIEKMRDKISQMFLLGSLSGIAVLGDVIREYLLVNLIVLFVFVNMGIILIRIYLRKKFDCM